jgi:hypothetical protein
MMSYESRRTAEPRGAVTPSSNGHDQAAIAAVFVISSSWRGLLSGAPMPESAGEHSGDYANRISTIPATVTSYLPRRLCHVHPFYFPCARGHCHVAIGRAFGNRNGADINPARTDPGGGCSPVAMDRPAQAGAPAGRHRRRGCSFLSPLTREPQVNPAKPVPGTPWGAVRQAYVRHNAERWPEQLEA